MIRIALIAVLSSTTLLAGCASREARPDGRDQRSSSSSRDVQGREAQRRADVERIYRERARRDALLRNRGGEGQPRVYDGQDHSTPDDPVWLDPSDGTPASGRLPPERVYDYPPDYDGRGDVYSDDDGYPRYNQRRWPNDRPYDRHRYDRDYDRDYDRRRRDDDDRHRRDRDADRPNRRPPGNRVDRPNEPSPSPTPTPPPSQVPVPSPKPPRRVEPVPPPQASPPSPERPVRPGPPRRGEPPEAAPKPPPRGQAPESQRPKRERPTPEPPKAEPQPPKADRPASPDRPKADDSPSRPRPEAGSKPPPRGSVDKRERKGD